MFHRVFLGFCFWKFFWQVFKGPQTFWFSILVKKMQKEGHETFYCLHCQKRPLYEQGTSPSSFIFRMAFLEDLSKIAPSETPIEHFFRKVDHIQRRPEISVKVVLYFKMKVRTLNYERNPTYNDITVKCEFNLRET